MAVNRFTKLPWQQYAPYPFEDIAGLAEVRQGRKDKALAEEDALAGLISAIPRAPGHEDYHREVVGNLYKKMEGIVDRYKDPADPQFIRSVRRLKSEVANDPDVRNLIESKQIYDQQWSKILNSPEGKNAIYKMPQIIDPSGQFKQNRQRYSTLDYIPYADYNKSIDDYLDDVEYRVAKNSGFSIHQDKKTGLRYIATAQGYKAVRELPEFQQAIQGLTETFMNPNTPEAKYFQASVQQRLGPEAYNREFVQEYVTDRARRFFNTKDMGQTGYQFPEWLNAGTADANAPELPTMPTDILPNTVDLETTQNLFKNSKFDAQGNLILPTVPQQNPQYSTPSARGITYGTKDINYYQNNQKEAQRQLDAQKAFINGLRRTHPEFVGHTDQQVKSIWDESLKDLTQMSKTQFVPTPPDLDIFTQQLFGPKGTGDLEARTLSVVKDGQTISGPIDIVAKELGYDDGYIPDDVKAKARVIGITQLGNSPGGLIVSIQDSDGKPQKIEASNNSTVNRLMMTSYGLMKIIGSGTDGPMEDADLGVRYDVINRIDPDKKKFVPQIIMSDINDPTNRQEVTLKDIMQMEKISLERYFARQRAVLKDLKKK